jgi:sporulation protein YlmC with PRC-barrel domain
MAVSVNSISGLFGKDVFTNKGFYAGKVDDCELDLSRFKIRSIVIRAARESSIGKMVGGRKGLIVPYQMVQAIGDVVLIKHIVGSEMPAEETETEETA